MAERMSYHFHQETNLKYSNGEKIRLGDLVKLLDNAEENLAKSLEEFKTIENWSMLYIGCTLNAYPTHKFNNLITSKYFIYYQVSRIQKY